MYVCMRVHCTNDRHDQFRFCAGFSEVCDLSSCLLVVLLQKETLMKKVEEEKKQEIKLSRLQAVQRVKQYKQVCAMQVHAWTHRSSATVAYVERCLLVSW